MEKRVKIKGREVELGRGEGMHRGNSILLAMKMTHEEAKALFLAPGGWSLHDNSTEEDFSEYDMLKSITDNLDGTVTVEMRKKSASERLVEQQAKNAELETIVASLLELADDKKNKLAKDLQKILKKYGFMEEE